MNPKGNKDKTTARIRSHHSKVRLLKHLVEGQPISAICDQTPDPSHALLPVAEDLFENGATAFGHTPHLRRTDPGNQRIERLADHHRSGLPVQKPGIQILHRPVACQPRDDQPQLPAIQWQTGTFPPDTQGSGRSPRLTAATLGGSPATSSSITTPRGYTRPSASSRPKTDSKAVTIARSAPRGTKARGRPASAVRSPARNPSNPTTDTKTETFRL
jgi:hypothetical protein